MYFPGGGFCSIVAVLEDGGMVEVAMIGREGMAGLITYHRGQVTIVDREALENASCECYRTATDLLESVTSDGDGRSRVR